MVHYVRQFYVHMQRALIVEKTEERRVLDFHRLLVVELCKHLGEFGVGRLFLSALKICLQGGTPLVNTVRTLRLVQTWQKLGFQ